MMDLNLMKACKKNSFTQNLPCRKEFVGVFNPKAYSVEEKKTFDDAIDQ